MRRKSKMKMVKRRAITSAPTECRNYLEKEFFDAAKKIKKVGDDGAVNTVPDRVRHRTNWANHHCCKAQRGASYVKLAYDARGLFTADALSKIRAC